ncbi:MAG TPA: aldolase/citrate lyase family protein [Methylomirabilota bacterium]|nr:aldolase/citrate lyase family protein [Methylomirabilota bacterium]
MQNALKSLLKNGKTTFGITVTIGSPEVPYALGNLGLDWVNFDSQHSVLNNSTISEMIQALGHSKTVSIVRVLSNDLGQINKALDMGAQAVIVPLVNTRTEAERAVRSAKYNPPGSRSFGSRVSLRDPEYTATADDEIMVIPQIETALALQNVEEIVTTDGVDAVFCGPYDLSMSLGIFRQFENPAFQRAVERIISTCEAHGVAPGLLAPTGPVQRDIQRGFRMISLGGDLSILIQGIGAVLRNARQ